MKKKHLLPFLLLLFTFALGNAQSCDPDSLLTYQVRASDTDPNIPFELAQHYAWINPTCVSNNLLLLHLVGTIDNPLNTTLFPELAANLGYHVISLKYPNSTSATSACRTSADTNCHENFRREIIEGIDYSPDIAVDSTNGIHNRMIKFLQHLHTNYPGQGWDAYYTGTAFNWSQIAISGHSQGAGHAALMAKDQIVNRVIMFAGPNDYSDVFMDGALWTRKPHLTPDSAYYGFGSLADDIASFSEQYLQWDSLGLSAFGDTMRINGNACPYNNSHQLYTTDVNPGFGETHGNMVRDSETPLDSAGNPIYQPAWEYLLGVPCLITHQSESLPSQSPISIFPNPFTDHTTIQFPPSVAGEFTFTLMMPNGQVIRSHHMNSGEEFHFQRDKLAAGMYFYQVEKGNSIYSGKLCIID